MPSFVYDAFTRNGEPATGTIDATSEADARAKHVAFCDEAVAIGGSAPKDSYLRWERILQAARDTGAQAIHPGYGFLSENEAFAQACADAGIVFIGPCIAKKHESDLYPDRDMALPPLNQVLAESLVKSTRAYNLLKAHGPVPAANIEAIYELLLHVSDLVSEIPQIIELDINPLIVDEEGVIAADARIVIDHAPASAREYSHLAILPYPASHSREWPMAVKCSRRSSTHFTGTLNFRDAKAQR